MKMDGLPRKPDWPMIYAGQKIQHLPVSFTKNLGLPGIQLPVPSPLPPGPYDFPAPPTLQLQHYSKQRDGEVAGESRQNGFERYVHFDNSEHAQHFAQRYGQVRGGIGWKEFGNGGDLDTKGEDKYAGCGNNQGHRFAHPQQEAQEQGNWGVYPTPPPQSASGSESVVYEWRNGIPYGHPKYGGKYVPFSEIPGPSPLIPVWYHPAMPPLLPLNQRMGAGDRVESPLEVLEVAGYERHAEENEATDHDGNIEMAEAAMSALTISESAVEETPLSIDPAASTLTYRQRRGQPMQYPLERPLPSQAYINRMYQVSIPRDKPCPLLIVLDLNGTLLYRKNRTSSFIPQPNLAEFLRYVLREHKVVIWSSAKPHNVEAICTKLFTPEERKKLVAIWARDKLRLGKNYQNRVQVYKHLSWLWADENIQASNPNPTSKWTQSNTVLIDDSVEKAASEPYNLLKIEEFEAKPEQMQTDVLGQVVQHLERLKWQSNVSAFLKIMPFIPIPGKKNFDWTYRGPHSPRTAQEGRLGV